MADDPRLTQAYKALPAEEPPPALDDAIRAAARRAVSSRPRSSRWQVPASIAAVLVLAFGIALQLEREQPLVDEALPAAPPATKREAAPGAVPAGPVEAGAPRAPAPKVPEAALSREASPAREKKLAAPAPAAPAPPAEAPRATISAPSPAADAARPLQAAPAASMPAPATGAVFAPDPAANRAEPQRSVPRATGAAKEEAVRGAAPSEKRRMQDAESPERWLERIAELRAQGRDAEADAAWEAFTRAHPGYRVPDAMLERVRPR